MAKKRSCRRTVDEDKIHEKAVKIRKMTDEQLVHYVEDRVEKARSEGFHRGKEAAPANALYTADFSDNRSNIYRRLGRSSCREESRAVNM